MKLRSANPGAPRLASETWVFLARCTFALTLALSPATLTQAQTATSLAKQVDTHYNHLQSLRARYTERYQGLGQDRTETGTLTLRKPGRMRWAYDSPAGKLFLLDGTSAIFYTPGSAEAQRLPAKQLDDQRSPLRFLLGHTELAKELDHLTLTLVSPGLYTLSGTPRGLEARLRTLALTVDATGQIHSLRSQEADGAVTTFTFDHLEEDIPTKDADFTFIPPAGVTIVNGTAPI